MRAEYDFSKAKRGAILPTKGKTRITIYIDNAVLEAFRARAEQDGTGYQTMMNEALKGYLSQAAAVNRVSSSSGDSEGGCARETANHALKRTRREAPSCFANTSAARRLARAFSPA